MRLASPQARVPSRLRNNDEDISRYFKRVCFIATSDGLRGLEEMSKLDRIRGRVQQLWMIPTVFKGNNRLMPFSKGDYSVASKGGITDDEMKAWHATYQAIMSDNIGLLESETFSDRFRRCLASFQELNTIGLLHYASRFLRDARQQKVRFLGWRQLRDQVDCRLGRKVLLQLRGWRKGPVNSLVLSRLLQALDRSGRKIRKLHACHPDYRGTISLEIAPTQVQYDSVLSILSELEELHVCLNFKKPSGLDWPEPCDALSAQTWLNLTIKIAPRLSAHTRPRQRQ